MLRQVANYLKKERKKLIKGVPALQDAIAEYPLVELRRLCANNRKDSFRTASSLRQKIILYNQRSKEEGIN